MNNPFSYEQLSTLAQLSFDSSCIVLADARLPSSILAGLPYPLLVDAGEELKTLRAIEELALRVVARRASRPMTLVAVGGGSLCDAVGFLASILWRGVDLWLLPSTLLAMVDSAHGGKTAVNLRTAKNQLGTFYPAGRVIVVEEFLRTLSAARRREGMAELLKALCLGDASTTATLRPSQIETCVYADFDEARAVLMPLLDKAIACKLAVVREDPLETKGIRTVLNLGHSVAHALELTAGIPHGEAVAWGLMTALDLSADFGLEASARAHLQSVLFPLLRPLGGIPPRGALLDAMTLDKKRTNDTLRSVVLQAPGRPLVTETISSGEWIDAFTRAHARMLVTPVKVRLPHPHHINLSVEAGKSELNRALMLAAQRMGRTTIVGRSSADDVVNMVRCLRALGIPVMDTPDGYVVDHRARDLEHEAPSERVVHCGEGGTTFRFLLALAATNVKPTTLYAAPVLLQRPHEALIRALRNGGAKIEPVEDASGRGYRVEGWCEFPATISIETGQSSQYASAIALLAAGADMPFNLRLLGEPVSRPFFEMTLSFLEQAGVETIAGNDLFAFNPTQRLSEPLTVHVAPDAGSEAVWRVAQFFEHPLELPCQGDRMHPDAGIDRHLDAIITGQHLDEITLDCSSAPDLVPVLSVAALRSMKPVRITGAAHLRHKESNRIDDLIASFARLGISMEATPDGMRIPGMASRDGGSGLFETHGDHRLVMAGFLLTMIYGEIHLTAPWSVTKSYPNFWDDARAAGFEVVQSDASQLD
jgi:3-phosphoshikimate 1-carboxyvinyltransferase